MIEQAKFSVDDYGFDARSMQTEATDKFLSEFEDHRALDERNRAQINWPFLTFWVSYAAGIVFIAVWR
jgi:hypothetical protein